jgi:4-aminobutyrate aminotransferase / (S)-3-amino-2-methylpropionate transaminase / 5-aminovalerate transaminase
MVTPPPGPASLALAGRLKAVESRNVTFLAPDFPVFWDEARGANVRDADGNVYIDLTGAFGVAAVGHAHPRVTAAIAAQAGRLIHGMGDVHPPTVKVELLERLVALAPWREGRGVLASTGSEAVEIALKTALLATGRPGILAFEGGYHGLTLGALGATHRSDFRHPFRERLFTGVHWAPFPVEGVGEVPGACEAALLRVRELLSRGGPGGEPIGAVIIEPIQARGGVRVPAPGFLAGVVEAAHAAGAVVIFDEIFTGFGRTGALFALEHEGVIPDLICAGKALGGGLPLSVCLGSREVMDAWPTSPGEALHTSTFLGHPLACVAALTVLDILEEERLVERSAQLGRAFAGALCEAIGGSEACVEIRGRGLLIGIELREVEGGAPALNATTDPPGVRAALEALREGILLLPAGPRGDVVELAPPFVLSEEQMEFSVECLTRLPSIHPATLRARPE